MCPAEFVVATCSRAAGGVAKAGLGGAGNFFILVINPLNGWGHAPCCIYPLETVISLLGMLGTAAVAVDPWGMHMKWLQGIWRAS